MSESDRSFVDRVQDEGLSIEEQFDAYGKAVLPILECDICGQRAVTVEGETEVVCIDAGCMGMMVDTGETKTYRP